MPPEETTKRKRLRHEWGESPHPQDQFLNRAAIVAALILALLILRYLLPWS